jgi:hypothetical protein
MTRHIVLYAFLVPNECVQLLGFYQGHFLRSRRLWADVTKVARPYVLISARANLRLTPCPPNRGRVLGCSE